MVEEESALTKTKKQSSFMDILKVNFINEAYGLCNHSLSCEIIQESFPDYKITWSDEGY